MEVGCFGSWMGQLDALFLYPSFGPSPGLATSGCLVRLACYIDTVRVERISEPDRLEEVINFFCCRYRALAFRRQHLQHLTR
jgi:hypothetical protein